MYIFRDVITGDEMFSDTYKIEEIPGTNGALIKVVGKIIEVKEGIDDALIGGNASAEGGCEEADDEVKRVCNIVHSHKLVKTEFAKKDLMTYFKGYCKKVAGKLEGCDVQTFKESAEVCVKYIVKNFKNYEFFMGEGMDPDGGLAFMDYEEDGMTPHMVFFKHAFIKEKV